MAFNFSATEAKRENVYVKIFFGGVSGSGKSYTMLRMATGMADEIENQTGTRPRIVVLNTESSRGLYYADEFKYKVWPQAGVQMKIEEFTPQLYVDWTEFTIKNETVNGIPPIIIWDTFTPAWDSMKAQQQKMGGQFKDWLRANTVWNELKRIIVNSNAHMLCAVRGKTDWEIDTDENGKKTVRKLGVGFDMRDGMDYEFTVSFNIDGQTHVANADKDNTNLFGSRAIDKILTERDGENVIKWANSGKAVSVQEINKRAEEAKKVENISDNNESPTVDEDVSVFIDMIDKTVKEKLKSYTDEEIKKTKRNEISELIKKHVVNDAGRAVSDYRIIKSVDVAKSVLDELDTFE